MAAAVLRSAARRLPGSPLFHAAPPSGVLILRAPPSLPLFQPKPVAAELLHPIPAAGFLVQRAPASRVQFICGDKAMIESMVDLESKIERLKMDSDLRQYALRGSWRELIVVETRSEVVDFSSLPKIVWSVKESFKPAPPDFNHLLSMLLFVLTTLFLAVNYRVQPMDKIMEKLEARWHLFIEFVTKYFKPKP